jgi:hypothetical protein
MDRSTRYRSRNSSFPNNVPNFIIGMARCGGGSVLSSFRCKIVKKQNYFANQIMMTFPLASVFCDFRIFFSRELLLFYGAKGDIMAPNNIPITCYSFSTIPCP